MSLIVRLRDVVEALADITSPGTSIGRATVALETIARAATISSYPERIRAACRIIAITAGKTPVSQQQSAFVEAAGNLEAAYDTSSTASPIERMILSIKPFVDLLAGSTILGTSELPLTCTRTGARQSGMEGGADVAQDVADIVTRSGVPFAFSGMGYTNLVSTVLTDGAAWVPTSTKAVVTEPVANRYRISFDGTGAVGVDASFSGGSLDRWCRCKARLISGSFGGGGSNYLSFATSGGGQEGNQCALNLITSEGLIIDCSVGSADATSKLRFRSDNASAAVIEIEEMRAANSSAPVPAMPVGSPAGGTVGNDLLAATHTFPAQGTIWIVGKSYGWSQGNHPVSEFSRLFEAGQYKAWFNNNISVSGTTLNVSSGGSIVDGTPFVIFCDWDGVDIGIQFNELARATVASATIPSGTFYLGNRADATRVSHCVEAGGIVEGVMSQTERTVARNGLLNLARSVELK